MSIVILEKSNTKFIKYSLDIILCKSLHNRKDYIGFISKDESLYPTSRPNDDRYQRLKGELTKFFKVCKKNHVESRVVVALPQFFYIFVHPIYIWGIRVSDTTMQFWVFFPSARTIRLVNFQKSANSPFRNHIKSPQSLCPHHKTLLQFTCINFLAEIDTLLLLITLNEWLS